MPKLSPARAGVPVLEGTLLLSRGKVRDMYELENGLILIVATNSISIYDFVLNTLVPEKGMVLNAMNHFWMKHFQNLGFNTHLVAAGAEIDEHLPEALRKNPNLQSRAAVVRKLHMVPVEFIARSVLTGSAVKSYQETGTMCGHKLPPGLQDGDTLPCILDTPTTKAQEGHDENLSAREVRKKYPRQTALLLEIFKIASAEAEKRGIKLADTKFEFGEDETVGDEILTPDSSRFWDLKTWQESRKIPQGRKAPPPFDKQLVREWGIVQGIRELDPKNPEDIAKVHALEVSDYLIRQTTQTYRYIFWRLVGCTIESYLDSAMGVKLEKKIKKIAVVCGSESDWPIVRPVVGGILSASAKISVHIISCHRNPGELENFANDRCLGVDAVICAGSKALALPGVLDSWLHSYGENIPVIGVALGKESSKSLEAAVLSIEELPDTPVVINEITGKCYQGQEGLQQAIDRIINGELPPQKPRVEKPTQMNVFKNF